MAEIYVDATNSIVGRFATYVAKRALLGDTIKILNCEKAVLTGTRENIFGKFHLFRKYIGKPQKGPFLSRMPDRFVRRMIKRMLPYKQARGDQAFKRIMCYIGVPEEFKDKQLLKIENASVFKLKIIKYMTIQKLCKDLGGKI